MAVFCHGTTFDNAMSILKDGFARTETVWGCSMKDNTYMWLKEPDEEYQDYEYQDYGFWRAAESAQCAAAIHGYSGRDLAVFTFAIPDEWLDENSSADIFVCQDDSCEGMDGAYQISNDELNEGIRNGSVSVTLQYGPAYKPAFRYFYLTGCSEDYMNLDYDELDDLRLCKKLDGGCVYDALYEDASDVNWKDYEIYPATFGKKKGA